MATIKTKQLKDGSYSDTVQVKLKDESTGKYVFLSKTFRRRDNIKTKNELNRYFTEIQYKFDAEARIKIAEKAKAHERITFREVANQWHMLSYSKDSKSYYYRTEKIIEYLNTFIGNKPIKEITSRDVGEILFKLNTNEYDISKAVLIKPLDDIIENMKIKNICQNGNFTKTTFQFVRKGKQIDWTTALAVSKALNIDVNKYFQKITIKKKWESETKLKYTRTLSAIFNFAIKNEYCNINYCSGFYIKGVINKEHKEKNILNESEVLQLEKALDNVDNLKKKTYVAVLLFLGVRNCEACGLEWDDIDFVNNKIFIQRDSLYIKELKTYTASTKNNFSKRKLTIPQKLIPILQEYKQWYDNERESWGDKWYNDPNANDTNRLFIREDGRPCNPTSTGKWLAEVLVANGIRKVSPHSLRHTNITILLRNGVPPQVVAKWAGHAKTSTTLDIYSHYINEDEMTSANCIDSIFSNKKADNN